MRISQYNFGSITVDGERFSSDVIIYPQGVVPSWWREQGHLLQVPDLKEALAQEPEALVIGTGALGLMKVHPSVTAYLEEKKIEHHIARTAQAVKLFNQLSEKKRTVAALHLTC